MKLLVVSLSTSNVRQSRFHQHGDLVKLVHACLSVRKTPESMQFPQLSGCCVARASLFK